MDHNIRVEIRSNQKLKQLNWFVSNYSNIFCDSQVNLCFFNIPTEVLDFSTIKSNKVKTYLFNSFLEPFTVEQIRYFEGFDYLIIPFKNKMSAAALKIFVANLDKIRDKSKVICHLLSDNFEEFIKVGSVVNFCRSSGFKNFIISDFNNKQEKSIKIFLEKNQLNLFNFNFNFKYIIDSQGNILDSNSKQTLSTIYKYPAFLIFN